MKVLASTSLLATILCTSLLTPAKAAPLDPRINSNPFLLLAHANTPDPALGQWLNHWRTLLTQNKELTDPDRAALAQILQKSPLSSTDLFALQTYFQTMARDQDTAAIICPQAVFHAYHELPNFPPTSPEFRPRILALHAAKLFLWKMDLSNRPLKDALILTNQIFIAFIPPSSDPILESIRQHGYIGYVELLPPKQALAFAENFNPAIFTLEEPRASYNWAIAYQLQQDNQRLAAIPYLEAALTCPKFHNDDWAMQELIKDYSLDNQIQKADALSKIYKTKFSDEGPPLLSTPLSTPLTFALSDPPTLAEKFRREYPAAVEKLEQAYSHVKIIGTTYSAFSNSRDEQNEGYRAYIYTFARNNSNFFHYSVTTESSNQYPVDSIYIEGGNTHLLYSCDRQANQSSFSIDNFAPPATDYDRAGYHLRSTTLPYQIDTEKLLPLFHIVNRKLLSIKLATWQNQPAIEIVNELHYPKLSSKPIITQHTYLDPATWAIRGNTTTRYFETFYDIITYAPTQPGQIPQIQSHESYYTDTRKPNRKQQYGYTSILHLDFTDIPRSEFSPAILAHYGVTNIPPFDQKQFDAPDPPADPIPLVNDAVPTPPDETPDTLAPAAGTNIKSVVPSKESLSKITTALDSDDPAIVNDAIAKIRRLINNNRVPPDLMFKWLPTLQAKNRYQDVADLALAGFLTRPEPKFIDHLLDLRAVAFYTLNDPDEQIQNAKLFYNSSSIAASPTALIYFTRALSFFHQDQPDLSKNFHTQQLLAAFSDTPSTPSPELQSVKINEKPYAKILARWKQKADSNQFNDLANYANLLLAFDHPLEAQKIFDSLLPRAITPEDQTTATEAIARCLRTQDTNLSRANTYLLKHPTASTTTDPQSP